MSNYEACAQRCDGENFCFMKEVIEASVITAQHIEAIDPPYDDPHYSFLRLAHNGLKDACKKYGEAAQAYEALENLPTDI